VMISTMVKIQCVVSKRYLRGSEAEQDGPSILSGVNEFVFVSFGLPVSFWSSRCVFLQLRQQRGCVLDQRRMSRRARMQYSM
jgi:hypothetical protein